MSDTHDSSLREGRRGDAIRGLDWLVISGPITEGFALRMAGLCFLGPVGDGDGPASYRHRPEIARRTRRRTLVVQRHGMDEAVPAEVTPLCLACGTEAP